MINNSLNSFRRAGLYLTCASVMVIELLGTRMIAHFYGISLYVWSSLISVTMITLALGYSVGGLWTDRAKRTGLSLIIALAALFTHLLTVETLTQLRGLLSSHGIYLRSILLASQMTKTPLCHPFHELLSRCFQVNPCLLPSPAMIITISSSWRPANPSN